jgi:hypothetical protein
MTQEKEKTLQELVTNYQSIKTEADSYKKLADKYNGDIKSIMLEEKLPEFITEDGIKATCSVTYKESFVEEVLIAKIKELGVEGVIKQKEYVDMEALENAIYHGQLNAAELAACQEKKEVVTLRISRVKN